MPLVPTPLLRLVRFTRLRLLPHVTVVHGCWFALPTRLRLTLPRVLFVVTLVCWLVVTTFVILFTRSFPFDLLRLLICCYV